MKSLNSFNLHEFINSHAHGGEFFDYVHIQRYAGFDQFTITDCRNALKKGAVCPSFTLESAKHTHGNLDTTNSIQRHFGDNLNALLQYLLKLQFTEKDKWGCIPPLVIDGIEIRRTDREAKRVFYPGNLSEFKPLKEIPTKWTLPHIYRALANGQFINLKCDGAYSDDYAWDAAVNFQKGAMEAFPFIRKIIESPSGWRCYGENNSNRVHVNCHTFDTNSFQVKL